MDFAAIYSFLFDSFAGIGVLVLIGIVLSIIACIIMERRTRKRYTNHEPSEDDWSLFDDDEEEDEGEEKK